MKSNFPKHIAIIMDGNRRWAKRNKVSEFEGHRKGIDSLIDTVEIAGKMGIKYVTVYALSTENYKERSKEEIRGLLYLLKEGYDKYRQRLKREGIRLNFIGNFEKLPRASRFIISKAKKELHKGKKGELTIAINYGGREEIVKAAQETIDNKDPISEANLNRNLYTASLPDPDLLIRTGGSKRLSNFLLWQLSYAELYFTDILWPDFDKNQLRKALDYYKLAKRNFGS